MEKIPITFYLTKDTDVTIDIKGKNGKSIWFYTMPAHNGFNQIRWDLVTKRDDIPEAYFFRYFTFAIAGTYEIRISGENIDLKGEMTIIDRKAPPDMED